MYRHQTIEYDKLLPAKISLCDSSVDRCRGEPHWHEEMQLIYVNEGVLNITVGNREAELHAGDVQLINPCEVHSLKNGFCHYNHFTKACHKYYGASPTEIKKQRRQRDVAANAPLVRSA